MADWPPLKGAQFLAVFPVYDGSGSLVTAAAGSAACIYKDGGAGATSTCDIIELNASAGIYKLTLPPRR